MQLVIERKSDTRVIRAFTHRLADVPNGVNVAVADLTQDVLYEGTPVGKDSSGVYHVVKNAVVAAAVTTTDTVIPVNKGHNLKVGDPLFAVKGGKCYAISSIATNSTDATLDDITIGTTLGVALAIGDIVYQGNTTGATAGALKYTPVGLVGESYDVVALSNCPANVVTIGQIKSANAPALGSVITSVLTGIVLI